jgi:transposase
MERKVKYNYNYEFKLRRLEEVLKKHGSVHSVSIKNTLDPTGLTRWISMYIKYGKEGLLPRQQNQKCSVDFKLKVL